MERYYKLDIRRLPVGLLWQWGNRANLVTFVIRKLLPVPWFGPGLIPAEPAIERVSGAEANRPFVGALAPASAFFTDEGYRSITYYTVPTLGPGRGLAHALLSRDGTTIALCLVSRTGALQETAVSLMSQATDGQVIGTGSIVHRLPVLPDVDGLSLPGAPPAQVLRAHSTRILGRQVRELRPEDVVPLVLDLQARALRHHVSTRLYVPATDADIQAARRASDVAREGA